MISLCIDETVSERISERELAQLQAQLTRMVEAAWRSEKTERELEADLRLSDDDFVRQLNRDYRGKDSPTDVLAFAQREGEGGELCPEILGDIVISLDTAAQQAKQGLLAEILFLTAHGLCHLLGYDHQDDESEAEMNTRMQRLLTESENSGPIQAA